MPHNRKPREQEVRDKYQFVVFGGEYSVFNALLAAADVIVTGGNFTYQYLKDQVQQFAIDLATAMAQAGLNPLTETLYFNKFIFENWETPVLGMKVQLPNKFVPYVAARKRSQPTAPLAPTRWQEMPGSAHDVGIGANGSAWIIGTNATTGGYGIYHWNGRDDWTGNQWASVPGGGVRIAVTPNGEPWVVNNALAIYRMTGNGFVNVPGRAYDIGIGADGSVWVIGTNRTNGGFGIYRYTPGNNGFVSVPGGGHRIAVGPDGSPWVVNIYGEIYHLVGNNFVQLPGSALDIGVGPDGSVWVVSTNPTAGGFGLCRWTGNNWVGIDGGAVAISVGPQGMPWVVNSDNTIFRRF